MLKFEKAQRLELQETSVQLCEAIRALTCYLAGLLFIWDSGIISVDFLSIPKKSHAVMG